MRWAASQAKYREGGDAMDENTSRLEIIYCVV